MKVAAYQAPLLPGGSLDALPLIRQQLDRCEIEGVEILCCPEGILGGLADYSPGPIPLAIDVEAGQLDDVLAPLTSATVATILGFSEIDRQGRLYNSAAVFHRGSVAGVYRKLHPAINRSVYQAGHRTPVFRIGALEFGILICNDSNFFEPARLMVAQGARVLFVPTNNGLPAKRANPDLIAEARTADIARAVENEVWVVRADVVGHTDTLASYGSSGIVDRNGMVVQTARSSSPDLIIVEIPE